MCKNNSWTRRGGGGGRVVGFGNSDAPGQGGGVA